MSREGGAASDGETGVMSQRLASLNLHDDQQQHDDDDHLDHRQQLPRRKASIAQMMGKSIRRIRNYVASNTNLHNRKSSALRKHHQQQQREQEETGAGSFLSANDDDIDGGESEAMLMHMNAPNNQLQSNSVQEQSKQQQQQPQQLQKQSEAKNDFKNAAGSDSSQQRKDNQDNADSDAATSVQAEADDKNATNANNETQDSAPTSRNTSTRRRWRRSLGASLFDILGMHYSNNNAKDAEAADATTAKTERSAAQTNKSNTAQHDDNDLENEEEEGVANNNRANQPHEQYDDTTSDRFFMEDNQQQQNQQQGKDQQRNLSRTPTSNQQQRNSSALREHPSEVTTVSYAGEEEAAGRILYDEEEESKTNDDKDQQNEQSKHQQQQNAGSVQQKATNAQGENSSTVQNQESEDNYLRISLNGDMEDEEESADSDENDSNDELVEGAAFTEEAARANQLDMKSDQMLPAAGRVDLQQPQLILATLYSADNESTALDAQDAVENAVLRQQRDENSSYMNDSQMEHPAMVFEFRGSVSPTKADEIKGVPTPSFKRQQTTVHPNYTKYFDNYEQLQQDEQDDLLLQQQQANAIDENELTADFEYLTAMGMTAFSSELEPVADYNFIQVFGMERQAEQPKMSRIALNVERVEDNNEHSQLKTNQNQNQQRLGNIQAGGRTDAVSSNTTNAHNEKSSGIVNTHNDTLTGGNDATSNRRKSENAVDRSDTISTDSISSRANDDRSSEVASARQIGRALGESVLIMESPEHTLARKLHQNKVNRDRRDQNASTASASNNNTSRQQQQQDVAERRPSAAGDVTQADSTASAFQAKNYPNMSVQEFADSVPWAADDESDSSATAGGDIDSSPIFPVNNNSNVRSNSAAGASRDSTATEAP